MNAPAPTGFGLTLEEQVLDLWFEGRFDTLTIAEALRTDSHEITEGQVAQIVADEMERRHAARIAGARP